MEIGRWLIGVWGLCLLVGGVPTSQHPAPTLLPVAQVVTEGQTQPVQPAGETAVSVPPTFTPEGYITPTEMASPNEQQYNDSPPFF